MTFTEGPYKEERFPDWPPRFGPSPEEQARRNAESAQRQLEAARKDDAYRESRLAAFREDYGAELVEIGVEFVWLNKHPEATHINLGQVPNFRTLERAEATELFAEALANAILNPPGRYKHDVKNFVADFFKDMQTVVRP